MLTLNDGRSELWQWDTGRTLAVDADCSQVHFSNKVFGRSIDVDVVDGVAIIPDVLLQTDKDLNVWAFVGTAENGYTKISKTFKVNRRNKPAGYVYTPTDQMTLQMIQRQIGDLADLTTEAKGTLVAAINEAAQTGSGGTSIAMRVEGGYIQYSTDNGKTWVNLIAEADLKGDKGDKGDKGADGVDGVNGKDGAPGKDGKDGTNGITPHIGENENWYIGSTDTGKPSRGAAGSAGQAGKDGKSAYQYAQEGGYAGTEVEFAAKLAEEMPDKLPNPNALTFTGAATGTYDGSAPLSVEIPSGGGSGGLSDYELIDTLDWSTEELAQLGAGKEYSFEGIQDICLVYTGLANNTTTVSGLMVTVNNIDINARPASGKNGVPQNGYVFLHSIPGIGLLSLKPPGANASNNYGPTNASIPHNLHPITEKITQVKINNMSYSYCTNTGILKIYAR